ncbi:integrating conjugative element protein, partial [Salmonella enterica]|nr:integrating conjugative element protein [Salmonella enterica]
MKTTQQKTRFSRSFLMPVVALTMATGMMLPGQISAISLPSLSGAGKTAGDAVGNAVSDGLFYSIGGGSVISQPPTTNSMQLLGLKAGINSDLMCG